MERVRRAGGDRFTRRGGPAGVPITPGGEPRRTLVSMAVKLPSVRNVRSTPGENGHREDRSRTAPCDLEIDVATARSAREEERHHPRAGAIPMRIRVRRTPCAAAPRLAGLNGESGFAHRRLKRLV